MSLVGRVRVSTVIAEKVSGKLGVDDRPGLKAALDYLRPDDLLTVQEVGDWAPAVSGAVTSFATAWRNDIAQLAAEANTTDAVVRAAAKAFGAADEDGAAAMKRIQQSVAPAN